MSGPTVVIGDDCVVIRHPGRSAPVIAQILGIDRDLSGAITQIWLDRLVHRAGEQWDGDWRVHGAVSSILTPAPWLLVRPAVGATVELFPPSSDDTGEGIRRYRIAEWHGSRAWMDDGTTFRWSPTAGFLL